jgi:hypothetical protein
MVLPLCLVVPPHVRVPSMLFFNVWKVHYEVDFLDTTVYEKISRTKEIYIYIYMIFIDLKKIYDKILKKYYGMGT